MVKNSHIWDHKDNRTTPPTILSSFSPSHNHVVFSFSYCLSLLFITQLLLLHCFRNTKKLISPINIFNNWDLVISQVCWRGIYIDMEQCNNPSSVSKADRKTIEKNRRNQLKALYSELNSLVPHQQHSRVLFFSPLFLIFSDVYLLLISSTFSCLYPQNPSDLAHVGNRMEI